MGVLPDWMIRRDVKITPFAEGIKRPNTISYGVTSYGYDARIGYKFKVFTPVNNTIIDPKAFNPDSFVSVDLSPGVHEFSSDGFCKYCKGTAFPGPDHVTTTCSGINKPNYIIIPPHSFVLGETIEKFEIPRDVLCVVFGKSTLARCGIYINVTPGEPEWIGQWTVEISNTTPLPVKIYCGEGIMQCIFIRTDGYSEATKKAITDMTGEMLVRDYSAIEIMKRAGVMFREAIEQATCEISYKDKSGKYQNQVGLTLPEVDGKAKP